MRSALLRVAPLALAAALGALALSPRPSRAEDEAAASFTEVPLKMEASIEFKFRTPQDGIGHGGTLRGDWTDVTSGTLPLTGVKGGAIKFEPRPPMVALDLDGDGTFETVDKREVYAVKVKQGDVVAPYTFRLRREYERWWFQRACMAVGEIDKTPLAFIDEDNCGRFNTVGHDVVRVGNAVGASALGKLVSVKGKLYEIRVDAAGTKLGFRPYEPKDGVGKLDLFSRYTAKSKPQMAVVQKVGEEDVYFDCAVKGGLAVPAGKYVLHEAIMGPSRDQVAVVVQGKMDPIEVKAGGTTTVDWGFPGTFDFTLEKNGNQIQLSGPVAYGKGGEKYEKLEPVSMSIGCEVVEEKTSKRIWFGPYQHMANHRLDTQVPWVVRLSCDNIAYLGPFQSEWR
jgi:hypothetical protein